MARSRRRKSRPARRSSPCPSAYRPRCGADADALARSAMVLTSAKAMSASASRFNRFVAGHGRKTVARPSCRSARDCGRARPCWRIGDRPASRADPAPRRRAFSTRARSGSRSGFPCRPSSGTRRRARSRDAPAPIRCGGLPASELSSGTASQSAITSNIEIRMSAPLPVRPRAISASRIEACAVAPVAISTTEMPTRDGPSGPPVIEAKPAFGLDQQIVGLAVGVGAFVAIARNGAADQRRIILFASAPARSRACPSSRA